VRVLQRLGSQRALTVFGREGLDEISISGESLIGELRDGEVREYSVRPEQFGLNTHDIGALRVDTVEQSRDRILKVLNDEPGAERDVVALNAGAAIYAAGIADSLADGIEQASLSISSGAAMAKLEALRRFG